MTRIVRARRVMLRILCAVAYVLLGFSGHHAAGAEGAPGVYYRLPDGSYASLCEPGGNDPASTPADHCKTCLIAQPHGAPAPDVAAIEAPVFSLLGLNMPAPRRDVTPKLGYRRMASRGPPLAA